MAKKKATKKQSSAARKTSATTASKAATKTAPPKASGAKKTPAGDAPKKKSKPISLGRPRVPFDADLEVVFETDPQARDAFRYLQITTVRELVDFSPDELVQRLTSPAKQTVGRIRQALALHNRALSGDEPFVVEFKRDNAK
ncbi:hypothetical protein OAH18_00190 [bacterium]|nr:hypothetical protein [bacterium]